MSERWRTGTAIALVCAGWAAGSAMDVRKYGGRWAPCLLVAGMLAMGGVVLWLRSSLFDNAWQPEWRWFVVLWLLMVAAQAVIYPLAQRRPPALRNDSEDALNLATGALLHGHFPYYARTFLGAQITPMPGALMLSLPFRIAHRMRWQNLFWEGVLMLFARYYFRTAAAALAFLMVVFANLHTFLNLAVGADYPANFFYVAIAVACWLVGAERAGLRWGLVVLLGIALSSRMSYLLVFPGLLLVYEHQRVGAARALLRVMQPLAVTAALTLPFYCYDPAHFSPLHVSDRLQFLAPGIARIALVGLVLATLAVVACGFAVRLTIPRVFLLAGIASGVLLGMPGVLACVQRGFDLPSLTLLGYVDAAVFFFNLWAFRALEDGSVRASRDVRVLTMKAAQ